MRLVLAVLGVLLSLAAAQKPEDIKVVHWIQSCHLDVGFANSAAGIIDEYFQSHFPRVLAVADQLRSDPATQARLRFMTHSYVVSLYLDCPPGLGFKCPTPEQQEQLRAALKRGDLYYHALPFNGELELINPVALTAAVALTHHLDTELGLPPKTVMSQRDVPGFTRAALPWLRANNVTAVTVGVNEASTFPQMEKIFRWIDPESRTSLLAMWHPKGYGGYSIDEAVMVPGFDEAMVFDWNGDNSGPYTADEYKAHFATIQKEFPNAKVVASTLDDFVSHLQSRPELIAKLPQHTNEIGDTWLYGVPSDPKKAALMRVFHRSWANLVRPPPPQGQTSSRLEYVKEVRELLERDDVLRNATRFMLKNFEHTWGRDVKSNLKDQVNYANADFERARTSGTDRAQFGIMEDSWWEQRRWGLDVPLETLRAGEHHLVNIIESELAIYQPSGPPSPDLEGFSRVERPAQTFDCGVMPERNGVAFLRVAFNAGGGVVSAQPIGTPGPHEDFFGGNRSMLDMQYETYSMADYEEFLRTYLTSQPPPSWAYQDFAKPNNTVSERLTFKSQLSALWFRNHSVGDGRSVCTFYAQLAFAPRAVEEYGAPQTVWTRVQVVPHRAENGTLHWHIDATLDTFNKTSTRQPEAMFVKFNPASTGGVERWRMHKLGEWINTRDVVRGGSKHQHGIDVGVTMARPRNGHVSIESVDAPVFNFGEPIGFPTPTTTNPNTADYGVQSMIWQNLWGTNYVMWYPFNRDYQPVPSEQMLRFRYHVDLAATT